MEKAMRDPDLPVELCSSGFSEPDLAEPYERIEFISPHYSAVSLCTIMQPKSRFFNMTALDNK